MNKLLKLYDVVMMIQGKFLIAFRSFINLKVAFYFLGKYRVNVINKMINKLIKANAVDKRKMFVPINRRNKIAVLITHIYVSQISENC